MVAQAYLLQLFVFYIVAYDSAMDLEHTNAPLRYYCSVLIQHKVLTSATFSLLVLWDTAGIIWPVIVQRIVDAMLAASSKAEQIDIL